MFVTLLVITKIFCWHWNKQVWEWYLTPIYLIFDIATNILNKIDDSRKIGRFGNEVLKENVDRLRLLVIVYFIKANLPTLNKYRTIKRGYMKTGIIELDKRLGGEMLGGKSLVAEKSSAESYSYF
jgi:hypothetical protein